MACRTGDHILGALLKMHPCLFICFYFCTSLQFHMLFVFWDFVISSALLLFCLSLFSFCESFSAWHNFSLTNFKWQSSRIMSQRGPQQRWVSEAQQKGPFKKLSRGSDPENQDPKYRGKNKCSAQGVLIPTAPWTKGTLSHPCWRRCHGVREKADN